MTAIPGADLTGTRISSNVPFVVYAGHDAAGLGGNPSSGTLRQAIPGTAWLGTEYVVAPPASAIANVPRSHRVRVISVEANTVVSFEPDIGLDGVIPLAGSFIETPSSTEGIHISANKPVLVAQYASGPGKMLLAVPIEHFATNHLVSVSAAWGAPNVAIVAPNSASVQLDGNFVSDWFTIGQSGYKSAYVPLNPGGAMRLLDATEPVAAHVTTPNGGVWHSTGF